MVAIYAAIYSFKIIKKSIRVERNKVIGDFGNIKLSAEINKINRDKSVTDGDINLYYKMYLKKWELDHEDEWITDKIKPMEFEEFEKRAKEKSETIMVTDKIGYYKIGGWEFLESMVSDLFVGIGPNRQMIRYRNYKTMVEADEKEK